jgi:hypothetical protein
MSDILISASAGAPTITSFRNIQFITAWSDSTATAINAVPLAISGAASGNPFLVNVPTQATPLRQWPAIVECDAGFVIAWIEFTPGQDANVKLRIFDADTFSPGDEIQVNTAPVDHNQPPALASLSDGGFVIVWADARADERIRAQRFDRFRTRNGPDFRANTAAGFHRRPIVAHLSSGLFVIGWLARVTGPLHVRFQIFDDRAVAVGSERRVDGEATMASITALDTNRFAIAQVRNPFDSEVLAQSIVEVHMFAPNGDTSGSAMPVTDEQAIFSDWPTLTPLAHGRFLVGWTQGPARGDTKPDVMTRIYSDLEGRVGQTSKLNTTAGGVRFSLCAATADGVGGGATALAAWESQATDGTGRALFGTSIPIPAAGGFP